MSEPEEKRRILLLLEDNGCRERAAAILSEQHEVLSLSDIPEDIVDLCLIDQRYHKRLREVIRSRKEREHPHFWPVLLATENDQHVIPDEITWEEVDGQILCPFRESDLRLWMRNLLQLRAASEENHHHSQRLLNLSQAMESLKDAVIILDAEGKLFYHNPAFESLFGYTAEEIDLHGIRTALFVNPDTAETIFKGVEEGKTWEGDVKLRANDGRIIQTSFQLRGVIDEGERRVGLVGVCTDITQQKRLEDSEHRQRLLTEALRASTAVLTSTLDLPTVFDRILENVGRVVAHDAADIMLIEEGKVRIVRSHGYEEDPFDFALSVGDSPLLSRMFVTQQTLIVPDLPAYRRLNGGATPEEGLRAYLGVPIMLEGEVIGFINLSSREPNVYTPIQADQLQAFAEQSAVAIQNARLFRDSEELAVIQERQRLARELHDAVSQTLFSASMLSETLPRQFSSRPEQIPERLEILHQMVRGALAETRAVLMELQPERLEGTLLEELLQQLIEAAQSRTPFKISLEILGEERVPPDVKMALYRITQEALNNAAKHAHAENVAVTLEKGANRVTVAIQDDGRGFDPESASAVNMGLHIMRERAEEVGATFTLESTIGQGTLIVVVWQNQQEKQE